MGDRDRSGSGQCGPSQLLDSDCGELTVDTISPDDSMNVDDTASLILHHSTEGE